MALVQFVTSVVAAPVVRLNLNDGATWTTRNDGTSFPPPPLRYATASTLLTDGVRIPAAAYGNRVITLHLLLRAVAGDAQATAIQNLVKELNRPANILMWQSDSMTNPVFFRTYRASIETVLEYLPAMREATIQIPAEPFGYGVKTTLAPVTVANNPASANGLFWDVTGIKGDTETPAIITVPADSVWSTSGDRQSLFATRRRGTPSAAPFISQAESATLGTDTTLPGNDAAMSGAGSNYARTSFATAPTVSAKRLTVAAGSDSVDLRGTYRMLARVRHSVSGDSVGMTLKWAGGQLANTEVLVPNTALIVYVDLGYLSFPLGSDPVTDGYSGVEQVVAGTSFEIWARRISGSGNLDVDFLAAIPADDTTCYVSWFSVNDNTQKAVLDGSGADPAPSSRVYLLNAAGSVYANAPRVPIGSTPRLSPGQTNRIYFVRDVGSAASTTDAIGNTTSVTVSYYPRYLYLTPATT